MKNIIIVLMSVLVTHTQAQVKNQYVLNTSGGSKTINGKHFEFSLGEIFTVTGLASNIKNTPGIMQPFISPNAGRIQNTSLSFSAQKKNESVALLWMANVEPDFSHFELEHLNGNQWTPIAQLKADLTDTGAARYNYQHNSPHEGTNDYRLKLINTNGSFSYSPLRSVTFDVQDKLQIFPNPASSVINIKTGRPEKIKQILLFDISGKQVYSSGSIPPSAIDIRNFSAGTYILKVMNTNGEESSYRILIKK